jgi:hypothetical protein
MIIMCPDSGETLMPHALEDLLEVVKRIIPSAEQREQQRRSFAYGNTAFENNLITREMVDREAERLDREKNVERRPGETGHSGS